MYRLSIAIVISLTCVSTKSYAKPLLHCSGNRCQTDTLEVNEQTCINPNSVEWVYYAPPHWGLNPAKKGATEIEGSGATHYVNAGPATPTSLDCKWLAQAKCFGDNGLTKGYCWISAIRAHP